MKKNPEVFIKHIIESMDILEKYMVSFTLTQFLKNIQLQDAVIRRLEIIGEAVKNLPKTIRDKHDKIPWRKIAGIRDILIHEYFGVDLKLVWEVVKKDIPKLRKEIVLLIGSE
jgi:uncharacterized protein with HEPN domain